MKKGYILIVFVLDRSGSMSCIWDQTIEGVNRYLDNQRHQPGEWRLTLVQFDDQYDLIYNCAPIQNVTARSRENYVPRGMTALHDAMERTIDEVGARLATLPEQERPERVLFVTQTDGLENASRHASAQSVRQKIEHQRNVYRWEFVFLGANQDSILSAQSLGISAQSTMTYAANSIGTAAAMDSLIRHTNSYGATGQSVHFTSAERRFQANVGAHVDALNAANDPHAFDGKDEDAVKSA